MNVYLGGADSPAGPIGFAVNGEGALVRLWFDQGRYGRRIERDLEGEGFELRENAARTARARRELSEYLRGERLEFGLTLAPVGSGWQRTVWGALRRIPFGETRTYAEVARMVGRPKAARAVGRANATNRLPLVVPCHRVIGTDGSLTGFGGGVRLKERLLAHERRVLTGDTQRSVADELSDPNA